MPWESDLVDPVSPWRRGTVHAHDHIEVNLVLAGSITYLLGGRAVRVRGPGYGVFWATHPHAVMDTAPGTVMAYIHLPLDEALGWDLPGPARQTLLAGHALAVAGERGDLEREARRWLADLTGGAWHRAAAQLEIRARLLRLLASWQGAAPAATEARGGLAAALRLAAVIEARWREPLRIADLAQAAGLSPSRAMEVFKAATGTTLQGHLRRYRIAQACQRLVSGDEAATAIAFDGGFASLSAFYEAFTRATGMPPLEYRRRFRGTGRDAGAYHPARTSTP